MRILYISYDGLTDPLGQSQILPYLTGLVQHGHSITILSSEKELQYSLGKNRIESIVQKYNIKWVPIRYHNRPKLISTLLDIHSLKSTGNALQVRNHYDLVHCRSYIASLVGLWLKKKHGVKFLFDMRGFWADERMEGKIWSANNPLHALMYRYFKRKEVAFLNLADCTISLTERAKVEIQQRREIENQPIPIEVIPCCVDLEHFSANAVNPEDVNGFRNSLNISSEDFVLTYLGSVGTWYLLDEMLAFFVQLMKRKEKSKFLFITHESREAIISKAREHGIPQEKLVIVKADRQDIPTLICLSTVSIFFIKPVYSKQASSPTKLGELLSMGVPVIANSGVGDMDSILLNSSFGILVNKFTDEEYNKVIEQIDTIVTEDRSTIRAVAGKFLSLESGVRKYAEVYANIIA